MLGVMTTIMALAVAATAWAGDGRAEQTYFDVIEGAFAVGEIEPGKPLTYRDGGLLVFPGQLKDVVYARRGKPRGVMIVYELKDENDTAPIEPGEPFFAPLRVLPQNAYWRDNLPKTPHHEIPGGRRYVFSGEQIEEVKRLTRPFAATFERKRGDRWPDQGGALVEALSSSIEVLREDAVRHLERNPHILKALRAPARERLAAFLESDAPMEMRVRLVDAVARAGVRDMAEALDELADRDDAVGAAAQRALEKMGRPRGSQASRSRNGRARAGS